MPADELRRAAHPIPVEDYRPCYACGMLVRLQAVQCRFCGVELYPGPSLRQMVWAASEKLKDARRQRENGTFPHHLLVRHGGKLRGVTVVMGVLSVISAGLLVASRVPELAGVPGLHLLAGLGFLIMLWAIPATLLCLREDIWTPSWRATVRPVGSTWAFFQAMIYKRWHYARALLLPGERNPDPRRRGRIEAIDADACITSFHQATGVRDYWRSLVGTSFGVRRWVKFQHYRAQAVDPDNVLVSADYTAWALVGKAGEYHALLILVMFLGCVFPPLAVLGFLGLCAAVVYSHLRHRNRFSATMTKWLHRVDGHWYLVCGEAFTGEDMLPTLYLDCMEKLRAGELPPDAVLVRAAGFGEHERDWREIPEGVMTPEA